MWCMKEQHQVYILTANHEEGERPPPSQGQDVESIYIFNKNLGCAYYGQAQGHNHKQKQR